MKKTAGKIQSGIVIGFLLIMICSCKRDEAIYRNTAQKLYIEYKRGEISECWSGGLLYYSAGINAADAGTAIYDAAGLLVATCNYAFNQVDSLCRKMDSCETIYRCEGHISGQPFVDKYGLTK